MPRVHQQNSAFSLLTLVNRHLVQHRVRSSEVNVLEQAGAERCAVGELTLVGVDVALDVYKHALPWCNVACREKIMVLRGGGGRVLVIMHVVVVRQKTRTK